VTDIIDRVCKIYIYGLFEAAMSSPNNTVPEGCPRQFSDGRGYATPPSFRRKLRDLVGLKTGPVWLAIAKELGIDDPEHFGIAEYNSRSFSDPDDDERENLRRYNRLTYEEKVGNYWDNRVFGATHLVKNGKAGKTFTSAGVFGMRAPQSVAPVQVETVTLTSTAIKDEDCKDGQDRGMAPGAWQVVRHGLYDFACSISPTRMHTSGCTPRDIEVFLRVLPYVWAETPSATRSCIRWVTLNRIDHRGPLGGCPEHLLDAALAPKIKNSPPTSLADYEIPQTLPPDLMARVSSFNSLL
jgi:CRISPR/Cas system type I-B associated protein Csh2 (Cas7 group RAMP superfamily)